MNRFVLLSLSFALTATVGCTPAQRSPDNIREDTAKATSAAARDMKAVAQGVVEGLKTTGPVNLNKATEDQLESLPGMNAIQARRVTAGRTYANSDELVKRHLIAKSEYDRIATKIVAK
jgi:DNA uptake protein ComE-like DNA-binding protein